MVIKLVNFESQCNWKSYINQLTEVFILGCSKESMHWRISILVVLAFKYVISSISYAIFAICNISSYFQFKLFHGESVDIGVILLYYSQYHKRLSNLEHPGSLGNSNVSSLRWEGSYIGTLSITYTNILSVLLNYPIKIYCICNRYLM